MMAGNRESWIKEVGKGSKEPKIEENPLENLDFEVLVKKIGFYQR